MGEEHSKPLRVACGLIITGVHPLTLVIYSRYTLTHWSQSLRIKAEVGVKLGRNKLISVLLYADDAVIFAD